MNHEVPQPTTATRSPAAGSRPDRQAASRAPSRQVSGWLSISVGHELALTHIHLCCCRYRC